MRILFILALFMGLFIPSVAAQSCDDISFTAPTLEEIESCVVTKHTIRLLQKGRIAVCPLNPTPLGFVACMDTYDVALDTVSSRGVVLPKPRVVPDSKGNTIAFLLLVFFLLIAFIRN
jgi:hypothetical protein